MEQFLLLGLGNPGLKYRDTRHNAGALFLDFLAREHNLTFGEMELQSYIAKGSIQQTSTILAKPQTYMNASGKAFVLLLNKYQVALDRVMVIHDDIDLPLGRAKIVSGGGAGGHKGVLSIIEYLGSNTFSRLKIGVGRPEDETPIEEFVLSPFSEIEKKVLKDTMKVIMKGTFLFLQQDLSSAMQITNSL